MVLESNTYIDISPYHEILSGMNFILSISVGVVKLTGPAGTGKTRLLEQLETELESERQETLLFLTPPTSIKDLHDTITRKLKLDNEFGFNKALIHHIIAKPYDQQRLVVVFDNAEQIDIDVLLAIALFRNIMHNNQPIVSIVLCGSEALNTKLEDSSYRPLVQDMLLSYEINPMTREQLQAYGNACADIHRLGKLPLKNGVLADLLAESKGLPGPVPELLRQLKAKIASGAIAVKAEEAPVVVAPVVVAAPVEAPAAPKPAKAPFRLFGRSEPKTAPASKVEPTLAVAPAPELEAAPAPKPAPALTLEPAPPPVPMPVAPPLPKVMPRVEPEAAQLTPDERLIQASRAEKEEAAESRRIDLQRFKPALQFAALVAGLAVVAFFAWPRLEPTVSEFIAGMGDSPAPAPAAPPAEAAPEVVEEAPPLVAEAPAPGPLVEEAPTEEPIAVVEPEPEPAPQVAVNTAPTPATPATPAAPAPQATRVPGPSVTNASAGELELVIRDWLMAWEDQDVDNFFSYYHTDFAPLYQNTVADWRVDRQAKISRPASIMIELEDFMIGETSRIGTRVSFWMNYEAPNYADRTLKEVLIGPDVDGQWRILQEYNQQTEALAAASPGATPAAPGPGPQRTQIATNTLQLGSLPAPVAPPPVSARATLTQQQIDGIARFLAEWLTAWQNQDVNDYFRHYEPGFKSEAMASAEQWRNDRIAKINRPQRIVLRMDQLEIITGDEDNVRVQLVLEYHSTHYADRTVKEIELRRAASGDWLIAQERNREVVPLPLMRLLPVDSLAFLVMNR